MYGLVSIYIHVSKQYSYVAMNTEGMHGFHGYIEYNYNNCIGFPETIFIHDEYSHRHGEDHSVVDEYHYHNYLQGLVQQCLHRQSVKSWVPTWNYV